MASPDHENPPFVGNLQETETPKPEPEPEPEPRPRPKPTPPAHSVMFIGYDPE